MIKRNERSFISKLDILSGTPGLFISGYKSYSTIFGLISTILILFIVVSYALYALYIFFFEREMTIVELSNNFMTTNLSISSKDFLFAFNVFNVSYEVEYFWGEELNLLSSQNVVKKPLNNKYTVKLFYENPETKEVLNEYYLETEYCEIGKNINQNTINKYNFTNYKNYLCVSDKSNTNIVINKTHNSYFNIIVSLDLERSDGLEKQIINITNKSMLINVNYLEFQMYTPNDIISNKNETNPINFRKSYYYYELISPGVLTYNQINIKYNDYISDKGAILKKYENFKGFTIESYKEESRPLGSFNITDNITYNEFIVYFNGDDIPSYQRTYTKFPSVLADIQGVISSLTTLGKLLVGIICKYYLEVDTMSRVFQSKLFFNSKNKLKQKSIIKVKSKIYPKTSQRILNDSLINSSSQKNIIIKNEDNKNKKLNIDDINNKNNELSLINTDLAKSMLNIKNNDLEKRKNKLNIKNDYNKNIGSDLLCNNEDNKNNNIIDNKINNTKVNYNLYTEIFIRILGISHVETQKKWVNPNSFSLRDYFYFIINKKKNIKIKIIDKLSKFLERTLSIEEIIGRTIDLEIITSFIRMRFGKEFNLVNYLKVWMRKDNELKKILENENNAIIKNNLIE